MQQEIAKLQKRWQDETRFRGLRTRRSLEREGIALGADTLLAKRLHDGSLESDDARFLTLLSVAYGNPVDPSVVGAVHRASKHSRAGDECMAAMHLALAPLARLPDPSDAAQRLFIADSLLDEGVPPRDIWTALDFDPAPLDALEKKYNPNQPRVPAGSGRTSGEWTSDGARSEAADTAETAAADAIETAAAVTATRGLIPTILSCDLSWMVYLSSPLARRITVPSDVVVEHLADCGLIMIAAEETFDVANPEHLARARSILNPLEPLNAEEAN